MALHQMKMPDIGEGVVDAEVVAWHVKIGDRVQEDQHFVDVMTDKATVEMSSPVAGTVVELRAEPGERIAVGAPLIVFEKSWISPAPVGLARYLAAVNPGPAKNGGRNVEPVGSKVQPRLAAWEKALPSKAQSSRTCQEPMAGAMASGRLLPALPAPAMARSWVTA